MASLSTLKDLTAQVATIFFIKMLKDESSFRPENEDVELTLSLKNNGMLRQRRTSLSAKGMEITKSYYSFTYKQNTGSLLNTRLTAMQRSMQSFNSFAHPDVPIPRVLNDFLNSAKFQNNELISTPLDSQTKDLNQELLEFLVAPYLDVLPPEISSRDELSGHMKIRMSDEVGLPSPPPSLRSSNRPPSMLRCASSMVIQQSELLNQKPFDKVQPLSQKPLATEGIPTPLQSVSAKQSNGQALFTTAANYPYAIKTLNGIACIAAEVNFQDAQTRSLLDFFTSGIAQLIAKKLMSSESLSSKIKLCGALIELNGHLMCLVVEESNCDVLMWTMEEVATIRNESVLTSPADIKGVVRINSDGDNIILKGASCYWSPLSIGVAIVVDAKSLNIVSYNMDVLQTMTGLRKNITGRSLCELIPQFNEFWPTIQHECQKTGIVIPEHYFRHSVGIPTNSTAFTSPTPSRDSESSIRVIVKPQDSVLGELMMTFVDIQLRVVTSEILVVWIGYSHTSASAPANPVPLVSSGMATTPPRTPQLTPMKSSSLSSTLILSPPLSAEGLEDIEELKSIKVGRKRRELKFEWFEQIRMLGRGAYGEVRLVRTPSKRHIVVLKSIFKDRILIDTWSRDRLLGTIPNEIKILNELKQAQHPHIVELIDFFEDTKCYHLALFPFGMPQSMDLFDFIETKSTSYSPAELFGIWKQIASAVAHMHSLGLTHRDIKDENVIMSPDGDAKLIDFGSAAYAKDGPYDVFVGTVNYAAPEVLRGDLYEGRPQDAWALGILLYIIMFKEPPFNGADAIIGAKLPNQISCFGNNIILQLLNGVVEDRPTVADVLKQSPF